MALEDRGLANPVPHRPHQMGKDSYADNEEASLDTAVDVKPVKSESISASSAAAEKPPEARLTRLQTSQSWLSSSSSQATPSVSPRSSSLKHRKALDPSRGDKYALASETMSSKPKRARKQSSADTSDQSRPTDRPNERTTGTKMTSGVKFERPGKTVPTLHLATQNSGDDYSSREDLPRSTLHRSPSTGFHEKVEPRRRSTNSRPGSSRDQHPEQFSDGTERPLATQKLPSTVVDPRKMLHLMRTTRGRMQGDLLYRRQDDEPWLEAYCCIDTDNGTLDGQDGDTEDSVVCLMKDLRHCKVQAVSHSEPQVVALHLTAEDGVDAIQLRPMNDAFFNAWFAALLCWQPVHFGRHLQCRGKQQRPTLIRQTSDYMPITQSQSQTNYIVKVGRATLVEPGESTIAKQGSSQNSVQSSMTRWISVSCTIRAKGELRIHTSDTAFLATVQLSELPRSSIQSLSPSVLGADCVLAIYPQYAQSSTACSRLRPIYLSFESREAFEVWLVLLRAHAIPELYGVHRAKATEAKNDLEILPGIDHESEPSIFRMENLIQLRLDEARYWGTAPKKARAVLGAQLDQGKKWPLQPASYYVEILLDGQVKAKSSVKSKTAEPMWYQHFDFSECTATNSGITARLKRQDAGGLGKDAVPHSSQHGRNSLQVVKPDEHGHVVEADMICGEAVIETFNIERGVEYENWFPLLDDVGYSVGEIHLRIQLDEQVILPDREYDAISDLLHHFPNTLTLQIHEHIPAELNKLSETLLNIFQVSGQSGEWLMFLAEDEIDGIREPAPGRSRFIKRLESNESRESLNLNSGPGTREDHVRDAGKFATAEASLLFRGNTLLSKSLDMHMRRVGRDYLENSIGRKLREMSVNDVECEVDPSKVPPGYDMQRSWKRLIALTEEIWSCIYRSALYCPTELRAVFKHIRACAMDRYGDYMRSVTYSSVSGFVFLRFFCAAVLNPQLFGLLGANPTARAQRTYILVAKSLQGLANMSTFGAKEPWMSPMNTFLNKNRQQFKDFIDTICNVSSAGEQIVPTSYEGPMRIFERLPLLSREGFLSLPYLIDRARNLAALVDLWLGGIANPENETPVGRPSRHLSAELARFHDLCLGLRQRTSAAFHAADRSYRVPSSLTHKWTAIAERMEAVPGEYWTRKETPAPRARQGNGPSTVVKTDMMRKRAQSQPVASAAVLSGGGVYASPPPSEDEGEDQDCFPSRPAADKSGKQRRGFFGRRHRPDKHATAERGSQTPEQPY